MTEALDKGQIYATAGNALVGWDHVQEFWEVVTDKGKLVNTYRTDEALLADFPELELA